MQSVSGVQDASASNFVCELMRRIRNVKYPSIAEALNCDESRVSRLVSGEVGLKLAELERFLESLGFKAVPKDAVVVAEEELKALKYFARKWMEIEK